MLSHAEAHAQFELIRTGIQLDDDNKVVRRPDGRPERIPAHQIDQMLVSFAVDHLETCGYFFRFGTGGPAYYLNEQEHRIYPMRGENADVHHLLRRWGFMSQTRQHKVVMDNLFNHAAKSKEVPAHKDACLSPDMETLTLNAGDRVLVLTQDSLVERAVGYARAVMISSDPVSYPPLNELATEMNRLRSLIGNVCLMTVPGAPSEVLTTRWSTTGAVQPDQAQWLFLGRALFPAFASVYSLWPILLHVGEQNSGKSTPQEMLLSLRAGYRRDVDMLPEKERDLIASVSHTSLLCYDNIDGVKGDRLSNLLCLIATGGDIPIATLYKTNELQKAQLRTHLMTTARVSPFGRSDVMRRCIKLEVADPHDRSRQVTKDQLLKQILATRTSILAEFLLRYQNILAAHQAYGSKDYEYQSEMSEYERYTLVCSEYEGSLLFAETTWAAYIASYRESIQDESGLVHAVSLWLGSDPKNANRLIPATQLHGEIVTVMAQTGIRFANEAPSAFGLARTRAC